VLTGDLADDPALIPGALELVKRAGARYGALASLGNHEYLHGIEVTRPKYEASPIPLLVSAGRTLSIGRARLFVGGSDDPVHMGGDIAWMLRPSIERAASHAPANADFRLLLCHRPEGHGPAADNGFDLTLSGHTHGGQIGLFGRSLMEKLRPGTGWWGTYARPRPTLASARRTLLGTSPSRLYTTSGFGHWFPFRVGCPTEMPIVVLSGYDIAVANTAPREHAFRARTGWTPRNRSTFLA
jgi:predicted MPP superfamily phosphohydrolase